MPHSEAIPPIPPQADALDSEASDLKALTAARATRLADIQWHLTVLLLCSGILVASRILEIHEAHRVTVPVIQYELPETCNFKRMSGLPCPGCGLTRGFISLAHGQVRKAWNFNPASLPLFVLCILQIPWHFFQLNRVRSGRATWQIGYWPTVMMSLLGILLLAQWCLKLVD